jgi:1,2-phenylacetyl-CoA epoxidase PaaB subunit
LRLQAAAALPAHAASPEQALSELRAVLARRSYTGLIGVLSADSATALEAKTQSVVNALRDPTALEIQLQGDRAVVDLPNGHRVELTKENGLWKIRDFE